MTAGAPQADLTATTTHPASSATGVQLRAPKARPLPSPAAA